jgi:hypothetical protein
MRPHASLVLLFALIVARSTTASAQPVTIRFTGLGNLYESRFDGRTIVQRKVDPRFGQDQTRKADLDDLEPDSLTPDTAPRCKSTKPECWLMNGTDDFGNRWSGTWTGISWNFLCDSAAECDAFFAAIKAAMRGVDCAALRATYGRPGQRTTLPPECVSELDRTTTYEPVTPPPAAPPPPRAPETVIDGSKIPSRIDFPSRPAASPTPAPTPPAPPPAPPVPHAEPSPRPRLDSMTPESQTRRIEAILEGRTPARPYVAAPPAVHHTIEPIFGDSIAQDLRDIEQEQHLPIRGPYHYPLAVLKVIFEKIEKIFADLSQ